MDSFKILSAEVLERAIRIELLVRVSIRQISISFRRDTAQTAAAEQIAELLRKLVLEPLLKIYASEDRKEERLDLVKGLLKTVAIIHEAALPTIPRVVEPIELRSYLRQSGENNQNLPLVFASERLGMQMYPNSLTGLLEEIARRQTLIAKAKHSNQGIKDFAQILKPQVSEGVKSIFEGRHAYVAIPAIDIHNPNRWPSLWHELAHHELEKADSVLIDEFEIFVNSGNPSSQNFLELCVDIAPLVSDSFSYENVSDSVIHPALDSAKALIASWLRECWCDAYGVKHAGLGFLYSQLHDFMFCFDGYLAQPFQAGQSHPPAEMRLSLARNLALERLKHTAKESSSLLINGIVRDYEEEERLFYIMAGRTPSCSAPEDCISQLYNYFLHFFKSRISINSSKIFGGDISEEVFHRLEEDLSFGFPIPSISLMSGQEARATRVSEIVLAGWRNRNSQMRSGIVKILDESPSAVDENLINSVIQSVSYLIERSDESIKRSIQVAEWFSILYKPQRRSVALGDAFTQERENVVNSFDIDVSRKNSSSGLLSDREINQLLDQSGPAIDKLRIVPLIDRDIQIKGTSIDLRLGHNFEVFQSLFESSIDACGVGVSSGQDSLQVEIDFLQGLPLLPGQFVLGHTLEYIKLPRNIAAQIEGRSSFARLGVQVHMTANLVEAGFDGCLTLEIHNNGPATVILYPGMRIAQLRIFRLAETTSESYDGPSNKYRGQLSHNKTKQFNDPEVLIFRSEREKRNIK